MGQHQVQPYAEEAFLKGTGKAFYVKSANMHLFKWGPTAPSGTPDAMFYIRVGDASTPTTGTVLYANVNGTWTVLTVS